MQYFTPTTKQELQYALVIWDIDEKESDYIYGPISEWNISLITDLSYLFGMSNYKHPMYRTIRDHVFDSMISPDISKWNTSNVTNMEGLFMNMSIFNSELNNWNVSKVENMSYMFAGCTLFNQPLNRWNTSNVKTMRRMFGSIMIYYGKHYCGFTQNINNWDVSNVTDMSFMFHSNVSYDNYINSWDLANVTSANGMLYCTKFDITRHDLKESQMKHHNIDLNKYPLFTDDVLYKHWEKREFYADYLRNSGIDVTGFVSDSDSDSEW